MNKNLIKKEAKSVSDQIRKILFYDWDPLGVNDLAPDDEYDSYVGGIYGLLAAGADEQELSAHLRRIEIERMAKVTNPDHRASVGRKLLKIILPSEEK